VVFAHAFLLRVVVAGGGASFGAPPTGVICGIVAARQRRRGPSRRAPRSTSMIPACTSWTSRFDSVATSPRISTAGNARVVARAGPEERGSERTLLDPRQPRLEAEPEPAVLLVLGVMARPRARRRPRRRAATPTR
jgi:hypothetical protein